MIRTLFKTRFWWLLHDKEEIDRVNFMWTQLRKQAIMETFPCKFEDKKSGLRIANQTTNSSLMQTPTMGKGKKKQRKTQLQSSTQSLESPTDKKDPIKDIAKETPGV